MNVPGYDVGWKIRGVTAYDEAKRKGYRHPECVEAAIKAAPPAQPAERVPAGWVLVPREPTEAQLNQAIAIKKHIAQTGLHHIGKAWATEIYEAMVANAECDCQNEPRGLVSNECPVHNFVPRPKPPGADEQLTATPAAPADGDGKEGSRG